VRPQDFPKWSKNPTPPTRYGLALEPDREYELQLGTPHGYGFRAFRAALNEVEYKRPHRKSM